MSEYRRVLDDLNVLDDGVNTAVLYEKHRLSSV